MADTIERPHPVKFYLVIFLIAWGCIGFWTLVLLVFLDLMGVL